MARNGASFLSSAPGQILVFLLVVGILWTGGALYLVYTVSHPVREKNQLEPADLLLRAEDVAFRTSDGVVLSGWLVKGAPRAPVIILCHDLGGSRSTLLSSAVSLNRAGYPLLVFDFRGHGASTGSGATLGMKETSDILAAIEFLKTRTDIDSSRVGLWGIGMGAYAGARAALDDSSIVALALDSLYPDVATQLDRLGRTGVPPALRFLMPALAMVYKPLFSLRASGASLAGSLVPLADRNVLLIAAADPPDRFREQKALYEAIPEGPQGGKNFLELKASVVTGLYAEDKKAYDGAIVRFFSTHLPRSGGAKPPAGNPIQVLERYGQGRPIARR
ncbi:MAG: alpha/beta fold hydrolase [Acidobacteria bacterium]|nr:alpha/beta fold hydrolase [Acidobacteriota bacterium]